MEDTALWTIGRILLALPIPIAALILLGATFTKVGKERGSTITLFGAIGLAIITILSPIIYQLILPGYRRLDGLYFLVGLFVNLTFAGSFLMIAIGIFIRKPKPESPSKADFPYE